MSQADFRVLGPLEVRDGEQRLPLGGRKQRALLAVLLLHANEVLSADRLIDTLWGESPPETAATALHGYVSQLRKVLEPGRSSGAEATVLVTREPGYVLQLEPGQLDLDRFKELVTRARETLADGRPEDAAGALRSALEIWRGPALSDLENEPFAATELPRLEELRLAALEERFEADLALGRERELIPELEAHIAGNPLRERPRGQLMLALYRAGRQAEALRAYQATRRSLVEEVGIEPGPGLRQLEQAILEQDPSLDLEPAAVRRPAAPKEAGRGPRPRPRLAWVPALALVAAAAVGLVLLLDGSDPEADVEVPGGSVAAIDLATNRVTDAVRIGGTPTSVSVGEGRVWVLDADGQTVSRIHPRTKAVETLGTGGVPTDLAAGAGALWVGNGKRSGAQFVGPLATTISSIDPDTSAVRATVELPRRPGATSNTNQDHIAVTRDSVWVVNPDYSASRIDPRNTAITDTVRAVSATAVAAGDAGVWALNDDNSLTRLSPRPREATRRVRIAANGLGGLAVGAGAVWVTAPYDGNVWRVDPEPRVVQRTIPVGPGATAVTVGGGAVWVVNSLRGTVSRIDPSTNRVVRTIELGGTPRSAAVGAGKLWVTVAGGGSTPAASEASGANALPADRCGRVLYGGEGEPDRLIVSDMPLRGGPRLPTRQMAQAIEFVLRERGFRAGNLKIGYQSCDDSTAQTGIFDPDKCAANAKAFAANARVIGLVGPFNSGCAFEQIPIAGRAPGGPLAILSPTNSDVGLTRVSPTTPEGGVRALYPTGKRNYARLFPTEAAQGAANALVARRLGSRGVFVLSDGGYGEAMAFYFARAARRLGLRTEGSRRWNPKARSYAALASEVSRSGAGAVFVSGLLDSNGGAVIRALRAGAPRVKVIASDGFLPISGLFRSAGGAARDIRVSFGGLPPQRLGPEGRNFVRDFLATQPGAVVDRSAVYAAASAAVMLDAIAGSDGTRPSVTRRLLAARSARGILAPFRFDPSGDVSPAPITIVRPRRGGGSDRVESIDGASIERVVRPPGALIR